MSTYNLTPASPADAPAIATIYSKSWVSPFTQLQFGYASPSTLAAIMTPRVAQQITQGHTKWFVMRCVSPSGAEEVAAVANWEVPDNKGDVHKDGGKREGETEAGREEREQFEDEVYRKSLPEGFNKDLIMEFNVGLRALRRRVLKGRKCYALENIATHPDHRGKGLASTLINWGTSQADAKGELVYLDTASFNPAKGLYKKLGFEEQRECSKIEDLGKFGGQGSHTHVAFLRQPRVGQEAV